MVKINTLHLVQIRGHWYLFAIPVDMTYQMGVRRALLASSSPPAATSRARYAPTTRIRQKPRRPTPRRAWRARRTRRRSARRGATSAPACACADMARINREWRARRAPTAASRRARRASCARRAPRIRSSPTPRVFTTPTRACNVPRTPLPIAALQPRLPASVTRSSIAMAPSVNCAGPTTTARTRTRKLNVQYS